MGSMGDNERCQTRTGGRLFVLMPKRSEGESMKNKLIAAAVVVTTIIGGIWKYGNSREEQGYNKAVVEFNATIAELKAGEAAKTEQLFKEREDRNKQVSELNRRLDNAKDNTGCLDRTYESMGVRSEGSEGTR